jgi:hypothetical protein
MSRQRNQPIQFAGFEEIGVRRTSTSGEIIFSLLKQITYWIFLLIALAIFTFGLLSALGYLPKSMTSFGRSVTAITSPSHQAKTQLDVTDQAATQNEGSTDGVSESALVKEQKNDPDTLETGFSAVAPYQVKQLQILLLEMGFEPGIIDGELGSKTRSALAGFEKEYAITLSKTDLSQTLSTLKKYAPVTHSLPKGFTALRIEVTRPIVVPKNAQRANNQDGWVCNSGFRKADESCIVLTLPEKAFLNQEGNDWECQRGYVKYKGRCAAIRIPANAVLNYASNGWECLPGYQREGKQCVLTNSSKQTSILIDN